MQQLDREQVFEHWQAMAELQVEFFVALGQHKLQAARAELVYAVAAQHWALARMKATIAMELESTLKRLQRQRHQSQRYIQRLGRHARAASKIRDGEDLSPSQTSLMWGGYTIFERLAPLRVIKELTATPLHPEARSGHSYALPQHLDHLCNDPPSHIDNVLELISWLRRQHLVPRRGTHAYHQIVEAFSKIAAVAETEVGSLRTALESLEKNTYDTWRPVVIAAIPDNVDAKKIISLGSK